MIFNPVIKKSGGGKMPEWEDLELGGAQDVPIPLASGDAVAQKSFELKFEQLPCVILFRQVYQNAICYSALYLEDGELASPMNSNPSVGVATASISGTTISGNIDYWNNVQYRPVYV